jgi:hypothetical protein
MNQVDKNGHSKKQARKKHKPLFTNIAFINAGGTLSFEWRGKKNER